MNQYENNYQRLMQLLGDREFQCLVNKPFMDLSVEKRPSIHFYGVIALCQWREVNGKFVRASQVFFSTLDGKACPRQWNSDISRNDPNTLSPTIRHFPFTELEQEALDKDCQKLWSNLEEQGFFKKAKELVEKQRIEEQTAPELRDLDPEIDGGPELDF